MSKETYTTANLIRRYRTRAGLALKESTKRPADVQRRHASLMQRIHEIFGDDTTLTNAVLVNLESQTPGRHREPTPRELYQIARALEVPMIALVVDCEDPFGPCDIARSSKPDQLDNSDVLRDELLIFGETDSQFDRGETTVRFYRYTPTTGSGEDPTNLTKEALVMHDLAVALRAKIMHRNVAQSEYERNLMRHIDIQMAQTMMEYLRDLVNANVKVPEKSLQQVEDAANAVALLWDAEKEVWQMNNGTSYQVVLDEARAVRNA